MYVIKKCLYNYSPIQTLFLQYNVKSARRRAQTPAPGCKHAARGIICSAERVLFLRDLLGYEIPLSDIKEEHRAGDNGHDLGCGERKPHRSDIAGA